MAARRPMLQNGTMPVHGRGWTSLSRPIAELGRGLARALSGLAEQRTAVVPPLARGDARAMFRPSDLFAQGVREDSNLELDWLWLFTRVASISERRYCLERALAINPHSEMARAELAKLPPARP